MNYFVEEEVLWLTRNDVTAKYPRGGAVCDGYKLVLKEKSRLSISVLLQLYVYHALFRVYGGFIVDRK